MKNMRHLRFPEMRGNFLRVYEGVAGNAFWHHLSKRCGRTKTWHYAQYEKNSKHHSSRLSLLFFNRKQQPSLRTITHPIARHPRNMPGKIVYQSVDTLKNSCDTTNIWLLLALKPTFACSNFLFTAFEVFLVSLSHCVAFRRACIRREHLEASIRGQWRGSSDIAVIWPGFAGLDHF